MSDRSLTCLMCGYKYDPASHMACNNCPVKRGCELTCCPNCGYQTVDTGRSKLVKLAERWIFRGQPDLADQTDIDK